MSKNKNKKVGVTKEKKVITPTMENITAEYDKLMFGNADRIKFLQAPASQKGKINSNDIVMNFGGISITASYDPKDVEKQINEAMDKSKEQTFRSR